MGTGMNKFAVRTYHSIDEISPELWDNIAARRGFQSHRWYTFGEKAMEGCKPTYLIVFDGEKPIAGAAFFRVHNEPLPLPSVARRFMASVFKKRPLLVCRSPLAETSALLLPGEPLRDATLSVITKTAREEFKKQKCSFLVFDFLLTEQLKYPGWATGLEPVTVSEPGTYMTIQWENFKDYLEKGVKRDRQHFKNELKLVEDNNLVLTKHNSVPDVNAALKLIRNVSIWSGSVPSPWTRGLLENFSMINGSWMELHKDGRLVGCGANVRDNRFQLLTALGLEDDVPGGYFYLHYAALQEAFENNAKLVRFGSGAYDVKRRLGFHLEDTNHAMVIMSGISTSPNTATIE